MARTISIGNQSFEEIREKGYFLVDKTNLIKEWWESADSVTLITRPRRFGKSLLISTLEAYFQGKKELFAGLMVEKLEKDWIEHPILQRAWLKKRKRCWQLIWTRRGI